MNNMNQSENYVPSVIAYNRAIASYDYPRALFHAKAAMESSPCDAEVRRWATTVRELESKLDTGFGRIMRALGLKTNDNQN